MIKATKQDEEWPFNNQVFLEKYYRILGEAKHCPKCPLNERGQLCRDHFDAVIRSMPGVHEGYDEEGRHVWFGIGLKEPTT